MKTAAAETGYAGLSHAAPPAAYRRACAVSAAPSDLTGIYDGREA